MLLLGRGRVQAPVLWVRWKSTSRRIKPKDRSVVKKEDIERDAMGRPIVKAREKSLGTYRPLPVTALTHELFESNAPGRVELDLPTMTPRMLSPGVVTRFHHTDPTSPLRVFGLPKHMLLEFRLLGVPCSVTTSTTLSIIRALEESKEKPARLVLNGPPGCGKSFLLLQAAEYAAASGEWIVLYIPRTRRFVDSSTPYTYSLATRTYLQPRAARETVQRLGTVNEHLFKYLTTGSPTELGNETLPAGTGLLDLIDAAEAEEANAPAVLEAVMEVVGAQTLFPVLLAIDDFQALTGRTLYRDPRFRTIRPHHLSMPRLLLEYASGHKPLARGLVLGALSRSDTQFPISAQLADALRLPNEFSPSPRSVRERRSSQLAAYLEAEVPEEEVEEAVEEHAAVGEEAADVDAEANVDQDAVDVDAKTDADAAAEAQATASEEAELSEDEMSEDEYAEEEEQEWTGWRVYDPPVFEDSMTPTAANPFPAPKPAELWKGMVLNEDAEVEDDMDAAENENADDMEEGVVQEADEAAVTDAVNLSANQKKKLKQAAAAAAQKQAPVRALRAVRVPNSLSVSEAAALFEVWLDAGVLRTGGERRLDRRTELLALDEWRGVKAEMDPDPEASESESDVEESNVEESYTDESDAEYESEDAYESESDGEAMGELADREYDEVRAMEQAVEVENWLAEAEERDAEVQSLDAYQAEEVAKFVGREHAAAEGYEYSEGEDDESEWEEDLEGVVEDDLLEVGEESAEEMAEMAEEAFDVEQEDDVSDQEGISATDDEAEETSASDLEADEEVDEYTDDEDADTDVEESDDDDSLALGHDEGIARALSGGLRAALEDPERVGELLHEPVTAATPVTAESGADELFMGKYVESSGNPRAFVNGLLGTLHTS
ncbi:mitochondrial ribosomal death-associated protein 3-domain-containing protein [Mycena epipterygia]|nr:mitochondrial ribosomal death-associated protein 3-domain-containing protein [Mycena epipterygia]